MYKLVVCDLDGTLVNSEKKISEYTKNVIKKIREKGVHFIIATGRNWNMSKPIYTELNLSGEMICNNGATVYGPNDELMYRRIIDSNITYEVLEKCVNEDLLFFACYEKELYLIENYEDKAKKILYYPEKEIISTVNLNTIRDTPLEKIVIMDKNHERLKKLSDKFNSYSEVNAFLSQGDYLDIVHHEVSKGNALKYIAKEKNVPLEKTIAFGDAFNDYDMLKMAGKGIVMANGFEALKQEFELNEFTNDEDGVAKYLAKIFSIDESAL